MTKLKSDTYKYKFAVISKERQSIGSSVWRCQLASLFRNFPSLRDAKRYVDSVEQPFETFYSFSIRPGRVRSGGDDGTLSLHLIGAGQEKQHDPLLRHNSTFLSY